MTALSLSDQDWQIRLFIYTFLTENARPPSAAETAAHFGIGPEEARQAYHRLNQCHAIFLDPGADDIRMAHPLSAVPTDFLAHVNGKRLYANCAWDSLGIPAMLGADATVEATIPLSGERVTYSIENGALKAEPFVVHFLLPLARWYDDLIFT